MSISDHLDSSTLHHDIRQPKALLVQTNTSTAVSGTAIDLRADYDSDNESEKPTLLELGVTSSVRSNTTQLTTVPYTSDYSSDIHLNNSYSIRVQPNPHIYQTDHALLFHNPYNGRISANSPQQHVTQQCPSSSPSLISLNTVPYAHHIPQMVYTWVSPPPVTSLTTNDINNKLPSEIAPPPISMTYSDTREYAISKKTNPSWKEKALQTEKDYKKTACDRERTRMRDMNRAFDLLRAKLPISKPNGKKYSKIESLRIAINYINHLQTILRDSSTDQTAVDYLTELNVRRPFNAFHRTLYEDADDKQENLDESVSTWSDGYIPNSQDKWE